jgi:hypothetical protein
MLGFERGMSLGPSQALVWAESLDSVEGGYRRRVNSPFIRCCSCGGTLRNFRPHLHRLSVLGGCLGYVFGPGIPMGRPEGSHRRPLWPATTASVVGLAIGTGPSQRKSTQTTLRRRATLIMATRLFIVGSFDLFDRWAQAFGSRLTRSNFPVSGSITSP